MGFNLTNTLFGMEDCIFENNFQNYFLDFNQSNVSLRRTIFYTDFSLKSIYGHPFFIRIHDMSSLCLLNNTFIGNPENVPDYYLILNPIMLFSLLKNVRMFINTLFITNIYLGKVE